MEKVCITESLGCTVENNTALYIKEMSGKKKKKKEEKEELKDRGWTKIDTILSIIIIYGLSAVSRK